MSEDTLALTPLDALHRELGARMVPFAGYSMPVQYAAGIVREHQHTREAAGLFDVSHMGQLHLAGDGADAMLETLVPASIAELPVGRQRYALFTNDAGGILDDLMVARLDDGLRLVVNAACKDADEAHLRAHLGGGLTLQRLDDRALLALQGPAAGAVLERLAPGSADMVFMDVARLDVAGLACLVSRSGYTGEDGFEISVAAADAPALARRLLDEPEVLPIGLGARDTLRLEAGLPLYGHDIDRTTSPVEAALAWSVARVRRAGGARAGGYPGAARIERELADGATRRRTGLRAQGRAPVREGADIVDADGNVVGQVTSGGFGPSVGAPVAMGYVAAGSADAALACVVRGRTLAMDTAGMPFVAHRYRRA